MNTLPYANEIKEKEREREREREFFIGENSHHGCQRTISNAFSMSSDKLMLFLGCHCL